jgi:hypothetical protein
MGSHVAVFYGHKFRRVYSVFKFRELDIFETREKIDDIFLCEVYLNNPPLKEGEEVFLHNLEKVVTVEKVVRSTDGKIIYYTDYEEVIDDEETLNSKLEAEEKVAKFNAHLEQKNQKVEKSSKSLFSKIKNLIKY